MNLKDLREMEKQALEVLLQVAKDPTADVNNRLYAATEILKLAKK